MERYAIPISIFAGVLYYWYGAWLAPDRDDPKDGRKAFLEWLGVLGVAFVFLVCLVLPWSMFEGWSFAQVVTADLPHFKMRTTVYVVYFSAAAGGLGVLHALVAMCFSRARPPVGG